MKIAKGIIFIFLIIVLILICILWIMYFATGHQIPLRTNIVFGLSILVNLIIILMFRKKRNHNVKI